MSDWYLFTASQAGSSIFFFFLFSLTDRSLFIIDYATTLNTKHEFVLKSLIESFVCTRWSHYFTTGLFHHCPSGVKPRSSSCNRLPSNGNAAQASKEDGKKLQVEQTGAKDPPLHLTWCFDSRDCAKYTICQDIALYSILNTQRCLMHHFHTDIWLIACNFAGTLKEAKSNIKIDVI